MFHVYKWISTRNPKDTMLFITLRNKNDDIICYNFQNRIEKFYVNHNIYKLQEIGGQLRGRQDVTLPRFSCFTDRVDMGQLI